MGGVKSTVALNAALLCACLWARAEAAELDAVKALAREKAAAVSLLKDKAEDALVTLAQDRLFVAYLNATTQGEGARLSARMALALGTLTRRFGFGAVSMIDRSGEVIVRAPDTKGAAEKIDLRRDKAVAAGFAAAAHRPISNVKRADGAKWLLTVVTPIAWRGENEFVVKAEQDGRAYQRTLARGVGNKRYVVIIDNGGRILSDSRPNQTNKLFAVAGLSLPSLRKAVRGTAAEGFGRVSQSDASFNVGYRTVDEWTVIAVEPIGAAPRRCTKDRGRLCG